MTKEIKKLIKNYLKKNPHFNWKESEEISQLSDEIESKLNTDFSIEVRNSETDYWLQVEYYSKKLNKTIIWDYDFIKSFNGINEFVDIYMKTYKAINKFEEKISFNTQQNYHE